MPPFLSAFRSRTNSLLDTITGIIPDAPTDATFKDNSLTCRKCGNRFRDRLELSSHFNLLPHHSDYSDSHNYDSFTRPKGRRPKVPQYTSEDDSAKSVADPSSAVAIAGFSDSQAFYAEHDNDKDQDASGSRPALLRKFPTLSNLNVNATSDQQPLPPSATDYADSSPRSPRTDAKGKGKQRALPRLRRDDSFQYGLPLASSDEDDENQPRAAGSSSRSFAESVRSRAHSASASSTERKAGARPRSSTSSSVASRSSRGQAPPLPPKIPMFDWEAESTKSLRINLQDSADETASINSDASFRTAGSANVSSEKARLEEIYAQQDASNATLGSSFASASKVTAEKQLPPRPRPRHASESNLLLESTDTSHDDAPPSYHELHGDTDPFEDLAPRFGSSSRHIASRSDGLATVPTSPVSRFDLSAPRRPRRSTNAWPFTTQTSFPVTFSSSNDAEPLRTHDGLTSAEDDLYGSSSVNEKRSAYSEAGARPFMSSKSTAASLPRLASSSSFSSMPSPSSPKTPYAFFADAPLASPPSLPQPTQRSKPSTAGRRSRQSSRAKSDMSAPSTRCPTCFIKFSTLDKTLEHLDNSDCGAVEFESGIM